MAGLLIFRVIVQSPHDGKAPTGLPAHACGISTYMAGESALVERPLEHSMGPAQARARRAKCMFKIFIGAPTDGGRKLDTRQFVKTAAAQGLRAAPLNWVASKMPDGGRPHRHGGLSKNTSAGACLFMAGLAVEIKREKGKTRSTSVDKLKVDLWTKNSPTAMRHNWLRRRPVECGELTPSYLPRVSPGRCATFRLIGPICSAR